jgi:hypothetical protein
MEVVVEGEEVATRALQDVVECVEDLKEGINEGGPHLQSRLVDDVVHVPSVLENVGNLLRLVAKGNPQAVLEVYQGILERDLMPKWTRAALAVHAVRPPLPNPKDLVRWMNLNSIAPS